MTRQELDAWKREQERKADSLSSRFDGPGAETGMNAGGTNPRQRQRERIAEEYRKRSANVTG
jgi:hypothetical protein